MSNSNFPKKTLNKSAWSFLKSIALSIVLLMVAVGISNSSEYSNWSFLANLIAVVGLGNLVYRMIYFGFSLVYSVVSSFKKEKN